MRIVYCIPHLYNAGGMERVLCQKASWLAEKAGYEVHIVTTEVVPSGMAVCRFPLSEKVHVEELNIDFDADFGKPLPVKLVQHLRKQRRYRRLLASYLRQVKADHCVSLGGKETEWLAGVKTGCRKTVEMHFSLQQRALLIAAYHQGPLWRLLGRIRVRQLIREVRGVDRLVVLTEADRRAWEAAGCDHVSVIGNPCSISAPATASHARRQVAAVGRLHPQKGFDLLLEAWQQVAAHQPGWTLCIAGEGPERDRLEAQVEEAGLQESVSLPGAVDDISKLYAESALLVLSSRYEGYPLVLLEGMMCGLPCVATDCPEGPREIVQPDTGRLVAAGDTKALAEAIEYLISHPQLRQAMGAAAQRYAEEHFAPEPVMRQWTALFETTTRP